MSVEQLTTDDLSKFSGAIADTVAAVASVVVGIDDGTRLTASGVVWNAADGIIVATSHGVESDDDLVVLTADGERHPATLVGRDHETDVAVLRIDAAVTAGLTAAVVPGDQEPRVGELAVAVGRPGNNAPLVATLGLVSGRHDTETSGSPEYILYTDAVMYPGFSGGALVAAGSGHFLGLLNRLYGKGMGVALGAPLVARVTESLLKHGRVPRGYLGVRTQLVGLTESLRSALGLAQERGLLIAGVEAGSAAEQAGLFLGDTLLSIGDQTLEDVQELRTHLTAGAAITFTVLRGGALTDVAVTVGADRP